MIKNIDLSTMTREELQVAETFRSSSSAVIYSIVETAKENGLNPFPYLEYLFEKLPNVDKTDEKQLS